MASQGQGQQLTYHKPTARVVNKMDRDELHTELKKALAYLENVQTISKGQEKDMVEKIAQKVGDVLIERMSTEMDTVLETKLTAFRGALKDELSQDLQNVFAAKLDNVKQETEAKVAKIQKENQDLRKALTYQQSFLESIDHGLRARVAIITGVPESDVLKVRCEGEDRTANTEQAKVKLLLHSIGHPSPRCEKIERLGREPNGRSRPIKLILGSQQERDAIVANAKKLKDRQNHDNVTNSIFIKKDQHPLIRQEWRRLYESKKKEIDKPENNGCFVELDRLSRTVKVNGQVVDSFQNFY